MNVTMSHNDINSGTAHYTDGWRRWVHGTQQVPCRVERDRVERSHAIKRPGGKGACGAVDKFKFKQRDTQSTFNSSAVSSLDLSCEFKPKRFRSFRRIVCRK
ncbi:hypothetical protein ILYODFUR_018158 [Ilyodon furcidens]|uniref:Uncharacterized protein n=1 Tax=Ilyodon furcidens TaxID=33524 RepID=A0ABV0UK75_9TELE